jgi:nucleoid-associated protein YejK
MILEFPKKNNEQKLHSMVAELEKMYEALNKAHGFINELELQCAELEATYDAEFDQFIKEVGIDNVPVPLLNYSTKAYDYMYESKD